MTALPNAMTTRNWVLTTVKALERALRQAESDRPATDSAPFYYGRVRTRFRISARTASSGVSRACNGGSPTPGCTSSNDGRSFR